MLDLCNDARGAKNSTFNLSIRSKSINIIPAVRIRLKTTLTTKKFPVEQSKKHIKIYGGNVPSISPRATLHRRR